MAVISCITRHVAYEVIGHEILSFDFNVPPLQSVIMNIVLNLPSTALRTNPYSLFCSVVRSTTDRRCIELHNTISHHSVYSLLFTSSANDSFTAVWIVKANIRRTDIPGMAKIY